MHLSLDKWETVNLHHLIEENSNRNFEEIFREDMTIPFFENLDKRLKGEIKDHVVIFIYGATGSFKSSIAQEIARKYDPNFSEKNILFTKKAFIKAFEKSEPNSFYISDESLFEAGFGAKNIENELKMLSETLRERQNSIIFIAPTYRNYEVAHFNLFTFKGNFDAQNKEVMAGLINPETEKFMGRIKLKLTWNSPLWRQYGKKKQEFLKKIVKLDITSFEIEKVAQKVASENIDEIMSCQIRNDFVNLVQRKESHLTISQINLIADRIRQLKRKFE